MMFSARQEYIRKHRAERDRVPLVLQPLVLGIAASALTGLALQSAQSEAVDPCERRIETDDLGSHTMQIHEGRVEIVVGRQRVISSDTTVNMFFGEPQGPFDRGRAAGGQVMPLGSERFFSYEESEVIDTIVVRHDDEGVLHVSCDWVDELEETSTR